MKSEERKSSRMKTETPIATHQGSKNFERARAQEGKKSGEHCPTLKVHLRETSEENNPAGREKWDGVNFAGAVTINKRKAETHRSQTTRARQQLRR